MGRSAWASGSRKRPGLSCAPIPVRAGLGLPQSTRLRIRSMVPCRPVRLDSEADDGLAAQAATAEVVQYLAGGG